MGLLENIDDPRDESADYGIEELVFACIAMFIFKQGSRHHFNQLIKKKIQAKLQADIQIASSPYGYSRCSFETIELPCVGRH